MAHRLLQIMRRRTDVAKTLLDKPAVAPNSRVLSSFSTALLARFSPHQPQRWAAVGELNLLRDLEAVPFIKREVLFLAVF